MSAGFKVVIPARYGSTRLPGKPLLDIAGKPMIVHVCERALAAEAEQVVVATDDRRIFDAVGNLGLQAVMTDPNHQSGTERIAEVASIMGWADQQIVVNLQGDEPLIPPAYIRDAAQALAGQNRAGIATLAAKIADAAEIFNPNAVKVVLIKTATRCISAGRRFRGIGRRFPTSTISPPRPYRICATSACTPTRSDF